MKDITKLLCFLFITQLSFSQTTEDFETETIGGTTFSDNGQNFAITNGPGESTYDVETFAGGGWNGTAPDNRFLDNSGAGGAGVPLNDGTSFTISTSDGADILVNNLYLFLSTRTLQVATSTLTITGRKDGATVYTIAKSTGFSNPVTFTPNNGFTLIDFTTEGGSDNSNTAVDELIFSTTGNGDYAAFDAMNWEAIACTDPTVPTVTFAPATVCEGNNATLTISGTLNDATAWQVYTGVCGGTSVGSTAGTSLIVTPPSGTTTYYVRGEGGCVSAGSCGSVAITTTPLDNASFTYPASTYCVTDTDPATTVTGLGGGTFSSTAGLSINAGTGNIDLSVSTPGTYTVTYTTAGTCPNSSGVSVTVNALDDASFNYGAAAYCADDSDPTPTISGVAGGTFTSTAGLSISAATGNIDVSASTPGTYTVTYTTSGLCPNSSGVSVTVNATDNASFNYGASAYCVNDSDPTPTISGVAGGTFSAGPGLSINAVTGNIDVSVSVPGTYTVTYTTAGTCPNSSGVSVTVNSLDDASYSYAAASYCTNEVDPTPTITGLAGGTFSSTAGLSINASTGVIDLSVSTPGTYTVTYTTTGLCPNSSGVSVTINAGAAVTFTALADLCIDAGVQAGLGGGLPTGGVYSGPGITDDGNGTTYSFDPAVAGVGVHTITYTVPGACVGVATDGVEVFALPTVTFTALADLCINDGVQSSQTGGLAAGGVYSGSGVTDDGNGSTYAFDPAAAGVGVHTITYSFADANGCLASASDDVEVFALPTVTFTTLNDLCIDAGVQAGLGGGLPTGGVYSGVGVTDDGNGTTYTFDPAVAGVGTHTLTYTVAVSGCVASNTDDVEVFALPTVTFTAPADACTGSSVLTGQGGGLPAGGVYSGPGVTDDANGTTYSFDPASAGLGTHTLSYSYVDANGCGNLASDDIVVGDVTPPTAVCQNINVYLDGAGSASIVAADIDGGSTDNCGAVTLSADVTTFTCANLGANPVTLTVTDGNALTADCIATVTVLDTISPVVTCPGDQAEAASVNCDFLLPDYTSMASATDNCGGTPTITQSPLAGTLINANTLITMTSSDGNGNSSTCSFNVTLDFSACVGAECSNAEVLAAMDPCGDTQAVSGSTVGGTTSTETSFCGTSAGSGGANWYTFTGDGGDWTASSVNAGTDYDTKIWVYDGVCGSLNCVTGNDDFGSAQSQVTFPTVAGTEYYVVIGGYQANEGNYELTFSNVETEAPVADAMSLSDINGVCEITTLTEPTATDNCSAVTVSNDATLPISTSSTITWTYTDADGNFSTQTQNVVLTDPIAPTASNPADSSYECIGDAIIDVAVVTDEADNCSGSITVTHVSDVVTGNGCLDTITRTYNVADESGNNIDVVQMIFIEDVTAPTASNPLNLTVQCIGEVPAPATGWVSDEADNCATPTVAFVSDVSDGLSCPETITRTFSVTDACGNSINVFQSIIVMDLDAPVSDIAALPELTSLCGVIPVTATATDNCDGTVDATPDVTFPITALGTTTITWTYTDACGNTSTQTQDVTISAIDVSVVMASDNITFVANNFTPGSGVTYQWIDCDLDQPITGQTNHNYTPTYGSNFAVIITEAGCSDTSACMPSTVGIDGLDIKTLVLYPNPTNGVLNIDYEGEIKSIQVVDLLGRVILVPSSVNEKMVDGSNLSTGKYMIRITTQSDQILVEEFVVQK
ncbi:MAG: hypothetical protein ACJASQ_003700 [Crocinitomicaceae bacterium]|jgi:hypothetical protein